MTLTVPFTAKENEFDVVLIDTAGRMQDNEVSDGSTGSCIVAKFSIASHARSSKASVR